MQWQLSSSVMAEAGMALGLLILAVFFPWYDLNRRANRIGSVLLTVAALWILTHALEIGIPVASHKAYLMGLQLIWGLLAMSLWLIYIIQYSAAGKWRTNRAYMLFSIMPLLAVAALATNHLFGLLWTAPGLDINNPYLPLQPAYGVFYWVCMPYLSALAASGIFLIFKQVVRQRNLRSLEYWGLILAAVIPLTSAFLEVTGVMRITGLSIGVTPFISGIGAIILLWSLPRFKLEKIIPIARDTVFERISDCIIVLDTRDRVVDLNPAAEHLSGYTSSQALGLPVEQIWPDWPRQSIPPESASTVFKELVLTRAGEQRTYDLYIYTVSDQANHPLNRIAMMVDATERKRVGEALIKSEAIYHDTFDNAPIGIFRSTAEGKFIVVNHKLAKMLGYETPEEMVSLVNQTNVAQALYVDPQKRGRVVNEAKARPGWSTYENEYRRKDGSILIGRLSARIIMKPDGNVDYAEGMVEDITEQKQAADALVRDEAKFRSTFDQSPVGSVIVGLDKRFIRCNTSFCNFLGYAESELIGKTIADVTYPEDIQLGMKEMKQLVQDEITSCKLQKRYQRKDGAIVWGEISISLVRDAGSKPLYFIPIIQDITLRKQAEAFTQRMAQRFQTMLDKQPYGILVVNSDNRVEFANQSFCDYMCLNEKPDDLVGLIGDQLIKKILPAYADPASTLTLITEYVARGESVNNHEVQMRDGRVLLLDFQPLIVDGKNTGRMWVHRDISAWKRSEEDNKKLQEKAELNSRLTAVGEMAAGIAHEINNPLTGVVGFSELLLDNQDLSEDIKEQLRIIADGGHRVMSIVSRMLTFARQVKPMKTPASINELIEATLELRIYVLRTANIEIVRQFDPDLPWITVDPGQMQQVFLNIIVNAEYAMKKCRGKGTLTVTTGKIDGYIQISFMDDGTGMDKAVREKIFNPFFTTKQVNEGTGLGLALSRSIVVEHGGTIEVESEPDHGATFIIRLPVTSSGETLPPASIAESGTPSGDFRKTRLLVVDDEPAIRSLVSAILTGKGHSADTTGDAREALTRLDDAAYDMVIMDIRMPGMSGMELYAAALEKHPELTGRFIFITGDTSDAQTRAFLEKNRLAYVAKPFDRETLLNKLNEVL